MNSTESTIETKKSFLSNLTVQILIAMILGAILGIFIHNNYSEEAAKEFSGYIKMLATVFIRLVQMIIAPLVITTLVVGIAKLGDIKSVGRIGGKAMAWFLSASLISLLTASSADSPFSIPPPTNAHLLGCQVFGSADLLSKRIL